MLVSTVLKENQTGSLTNVILLSGRLLCRLCLHLDWVCSGDDGSRETRLILAGNDDRLNGLQEKVTG